MDPQPAATGAADQRPTTEPAVAEAMRRVQGQLRAGAPPSFEALLALGEPA